MDESTKLLLIYAAIGLIVVGVTTMSDLALANVEALAESEISNSGCEPSWNQECCVCFKVHHTYAYSNGKNGCETKTNCSHY